LNKIILFLLISIILIPNINAEEIIITLNTTYNISELPIMGMHELNLSLTPNATLEFKEIQSNPKAILNYKNKIELDTNTSIAEWKIEYIIPFFADYTDNFTIIENIIAVNNSINDKIVLIKLEQTILHPPIINQTTSNETYLQLKDGGKQVEIYTFSAIDFNQTHHIDIKAPNGAIINITCGEFITCPSNTTIIENNETRINAQIFIPKGQIGGNYSSFVTLTTGNNTGTINFTIIVRMDDISNIILYDIWDESCYESTESLAECYKIQARYNSEIANALLERLRTENLSCDITERLNETIKYVEVGNIDPELLKDNRELRNKYNTLSQDYGTLSTEYTTCMTQKSSLETQIIRETEELSEEFILRRSSLEKETLEKQNQIRQDYINKMNNIIGILFFFFLILWLGGIYLESQWAITGFPKKIIGIILLIIMLGWIIFRIYA